MPDEIKVKHRIWIEWGGSQIIGPGIYDILKSVEETGSIASAARKLGFSYKFIWTYLKKLEEILGTPLVVSKRGGRERGKTELTEVGQMLLSYYEEILKNVENVLKPWEKKFAELIENIHKYKIEEEEEIPYYEE